MLVYHGIVKFTLVLDIQNAFGVQALFRVVLSNLLSHGLVVLVYHIITASQLAIGFPFAILVEFLLKLFRVQVAGGANFYIFKILWFSTIS